MPTGLVVCQIVLGPLLHPTRVSSYYDYYEPLSRTGHVCTFLCFLFASKIDFWNRSTCNFNVHERSADKFPENPKNLYHTVVCYGTVPNYYQKNNNKSHDYLKAHHSTFSSFWYNIEYPSSWQKILYAVEDNWMNWRYV